MTAPSPCILCCRPAKVAERVVLVPHSIPRGSQRSVFHREMRKIAKGFSRFGPTRITPLKRSWFVAIGFDGRIQCNVALYAAHDLVEKAMMAVRHAR